MSTSSWRLILRTTRNVLNEIHRKFRHDKATTEVEMGGKMGEYEKLGGGGKERSCQDPYWPLIFWFVITRKQR